MNYDEDTVKILFRLKSGQIIKPGWYLPRKAIISDALPNKSFILAPGKPKNKIQKDSTKISIEAIKIKLYPLENCKTCKDCHYGNNSTFCKHSAYNFPFDSLKLEEGFVDCPYFDEPYDD